MVPRVFSLSERGKGRAGYLRGDWPALPSDFFSAIYKERFEWEPSNYSDNLTSKLRLSQLG
jgi:hypothetical protein